LAVPYFKFADNPAKSIDHEPLNSILAWTKEIAELIYSDYC
jgi:hypothetical protein